MLDRERVASHVEPTWDNDILPALHEFIGIPNVSVGFDPAWEANGHMARAVELVRAWCAGRSIAGAEVRVHELPGRTPVITVDVAPFGGGASDDTVLLYGHLDKQPPFEGWREGLGPWTPVRDGDRLYGRGSADDGYAAFSALTAIEAVQSSGGAHTRCVVLIEASEESGSPDLPAHLETLGDALGSPSLVIGLDSWCGGWEHLWLTTSLRGVITLVVTVEVLTEGVHSGSAGGIVPSSFRILRALLDRIEDPATGALLVDELHADVPDERRRQTADVAPLLDDLVDRFPFVEGVRPEREGVVDMLLARTWHPSLEVIGMAGAPRPEDAGNVLRPSTTAVLSIRVPPTADARRAAQAVCNVLTADPPYGARVTCRIDAAESGWAAPPSEPWFDDAVAAASDAAFGAPPRALGEGGTIPFMGMLGERFPAAQFVITGVLGPGTNAHGPNEFLHIPTAKRVTTAVAHLLDAHARR